MIQNEPPSNGNEAMEPTFDAPASKIMPFASIIVPARNEKQNIRHCVTSLLEQDYDNYEVIVVDDGSTDGTQRILDEIEQSHPHSQRLFILRLCGKNPPEGRSAKRYAIYFGAQEAHGDWLLFTEPNTWHSSDALSAAITQAMDEATDLLYTKRLWIVRGKNLPEGLSDKLDAVRSSVQDTDTRHTPDALNSAVTQATDKGSHLLSLRTEQEQANRINKVNDSTSQAASQTQQERPTAALEVPERPALAPNVQLIGELQESGFKDRQWLIQRGGRFIQLTELLYRVAEQANGERTIEEIAEGVTETTDWIVSPDNVRQIIQTKLIPMGLVATVTPDISVVPREGGLVGIECVRRLRSICT